MEIEITEQEENPLMERNEIKFEINHMGSSTPSRAKAVEMISEKLDESEDSIVLEKIVTLHGRQTAMGKARIYDSEDMKEELEPGYVSDRTLASKERVKGEEEESGEEEATEEESGEEESSDNDNEE